MTTVKAKDIQRKRDRTPFRPFILELTSGTRITVRHPENILVGKDLGAVRVRNGDVVLFTPQEVAAIYPAKNGRRRNGR